MWCPKCGHEMTKVVHTDKANNVRRWRRCVACDYGFVTRETMECKPEDVTYANYTKNDRQLGMFDE